MKAKSPRYLAKNLLVLAEKLSTRQAAGHFLIQLKRQRVRRKLSRILRILPEVEAQMKGQKLVKIVSARPLGSASKEKLTGRLAKKIGQPVILETQVDRGLIGGLKVQIDDERLDSTLKGLLEALAQ